MQRLAFVLMACMALAGTAQAEDAYAWLQKMNLASRTLSFTGVFVYQSQGRTESSRIVRLVDGSGEHERLETLDGTPREVVRFNEDVRCYLPADKLLVLDRAIPARQPGRLVSKPTTLSEIYSARITGTGRVAGREAEVISLEPRDAYRYGYQLWVDTATGLLLKSRLLTGKDVPAEQFSFIELTPGNNIEHDALRPQTASVAGWRVVNAAGEPVRAEEIPWRFQKLPPGFKQVSLVRRAMHHEGASAIHAAFSDGFANVSVFIEASGEQVAQQEPQLTGAVAMYRRSSGDNLVTVVGEVPVAALKRIAEGVERRK